MRADKPVLGVGIVGAGAIFHQHAKAIARMGDVVRLIAVADTDRYRLRDATNKYFIPIAYDDYRRLLDRADVDIVVICTPPFLHKEHVVEALRADKYVNCEKPLATNLGAADRLIDESAKHGDRLSISHQLRFHRDFRKLAWILDQGYLGEIQGGTVTRREGFSDSRFNSWWGNWEIAGGGVVITQFIHQLDLLIQLLGEPQKVCARLDTNQAPIESEDSFTATIEFKNGVIIRCDATIVCEHNNAESRLELRGDAGKAAFPWTFEQWSSKAEAEAALSDAFPKSHEPSMSVPARAWRKGLRLLKLGGHLSHEPSPLETYYRTMVEAIYSGGSLPVTPASARRALELSMGIYAAGISGGAVALPLEPSHSIYEGVSAEMYDKRYSLRARSDSTV